MDTKTSTGQIHYIRSFQPGKIIFGAFGIFLCAYIFYIFASGNVDWATTFGYLFDDRILSGVAYTLIYSILSMLLGIIGGLVLVIFILGDNPVWTNIAKGYISLFRSLPLIILLLIFYNIAIFIPNISLSVPFSDVDYNIATNAVITPFMAAVIGLALHEAAYMAEIIRAGISGVDKGQVQAARSLGMTFIEQLRWVILPQATRIIIPPTANQFISMLKNTSLVVVIAGNDLLTVAKTIYSANYMTMELLFVASIWYLFLVVIFTYIAKYLEIKSQQGFQH